MKKYSFLIVIILAVMFGNIAKAQWHRFNFPNLKPYNTNSKYMYSIGTDSTYSTYFLRTTNDWQAWDTVYTGFTIYWQTWEPYTAFTTSNFAADSTGQVLVANSTGTGSRTYNIYLSQHQNSFYFLTTLTQVVYCNLYINKNYIYLLNDDALRSYRSTNYGYSFDTLQIFSGSSGTAVWSISAICDSILYAFCEMYIHPYNQYNIASFNGGNTWTNYYMNATGKSIYVQPYIFLGYYPSIYRSSDGGHSYNNCSPSISGVESFAYRNGVLLAGTVSQGVYATINKGNTWVAFNDGLDTLCCNAQVAVTDSFYYVTLNDTVIYRRPTHDLMAITNLATEPTISLFPNPATDKITISLPENTSSFSYKLYDMQGRLQFAGKTSNTQTELNVATLPRGLYVLKIITNKQSVAKKIVLQ